MNNLILFFLLSPFEFLAIVVVSLLLGIIVIGALCTHPKLASTSGVLTTIAIGIGLLWGGNTGQKVSTIQNPKAYISGVTTEQNGPSQLILTVDPKVTEKTQKLLGNSIPIVNKTGGRECKLNLAEAKTLTKLGISLPCSPAVQT